MKSLLRVAPLLGAALLSACTYGIVLDSGGQSVNTDWNGQRVRGCRDIGRVTVSVMSRVGPVDRNDIKVRDELEIMARNQAAQMRADTVAPLGDPHDGEQSWEAYSCGTITPRSDAPAYAPNAQGNGAPVEDVTPPGAAPQSDYPTDDSGQNAQPQPFSAPAPAGSGAQSYPMSASSG